MLLGYKMLIKPVDGHDCPSTKRVHTVLQHIPQAAGFKNTNHMEPVAASRLHHQVSSARTAHG